MFSIKGRLPIRCELQPLTDKDFVRILVDTKFNLLMQQKALLATEGVLLEFTDDAVKEIAKIAYELNTGKLRKNIYQIRLDTTYIFCFFNFFNAHT